MKHSRQAGRRSRESGFTLLETMIAATIVTVGLVGLLAVFAMAVGSTQTVQQDFLARQRAMEALESVYAARQTAQITWDQIQNVGNGTGIFNGGLIQLTDPGPDGLDDTADDIPVGVITVPGPSGVLKGSSPPDVNISLSNFQRQVLITNVNNTDGSLNPNLRQITITIQYPVGGKSKQYTVQALISSYR
jgi:type II secretory pathway pseudopilin PulG